MRLLDGINDTKDELYTFDSIMEMETKTTSKGLKALKEIEMIHCNGCFYFPKEDCPCKVIEKELKALEIVKNSVVATPNIPIIKTPVGEFVEITLAVTKDKYDLLKEVLL